MNESHAIFIHEIMTNTVEQYCATIRVICKQTDHLILAPDQRDPIGLKPRCCFANMSEFSSHKYK